MSNRKEDRLLATIDKLRFENGVLQSRLGGRTKEVLVLLEQIEEIKRALDGHGLELRITSRDPLGDW